MRAPGGDRAPAGSAVLDVILDALAERIADKLAARQPARPAASEPAQRREHEWLTCAQAAARLGVRPKTLEQWRAESRGPKWSRLGARSVRYAVADVDAFARQGGRP